jgi:hypothetical protein
MGSGLERTKQDLRQFWNWVAAEGDRQAALEQWGTAQNAGLPVNAQATQSRQLGGEKDSKPRGFATEAVESNPTPGGGQGGVPNVGGALPWRRDRHFQVSSRLALGELRPGANERVSKPSSER